ncbi:MAG TPA: Holliday junction resolvase RuvX, partial [Acidimicrobiia bacterium]|nr:Holliday junction resolvase RuvX [Acidimicrobiia bacterium]
RRSVSRYLGVDVGAKRVGLALSDPIGLTATPLEVVDRATAVDEITRLAQIHEVGTIVVGLPTSLGGGEGTSAVDARSLGDQLAQATEAEIVYLDERFTSRMAESALLESGMKRRERKTTIDKVAAAIILQDYLNSLK